MRRFIAWSIQNDRSGCCAGLLLFSTPSSFRSSFFKAAARRFAAALVLPWSLCCCGCFWELVAAAAASGGGKPIKLVTSSQRHAPIRIVCLAALEQSNMSDSSPSWVVIVVLCKIPSSTRRSRSAWSVAEARKAAGRARQKVGAGTAVCPVAFVRNCNTGSTFCRVCSSDDSLVVEYAGSPPSVPVLVLQLGAAGCCALPVFAGALLLTRMKHGAAPYLASVPIQRKRLPSSPVRCKPAPAPFAPGGLSIYLKLCCYISTS